MVRLLMPELQLVSLKILTASAPSSSKKGLRASNAFADDFCDNCEASIRLKIKMETIEIPATASISRCPSTSDVEGSYKCFFHWILTILVGLTLIILYLLLSDLSLTRKEP